MAPFDKEAYYKPIIREMIMHENDLINHRLIWLCQIQGFLFASFAVIWTVNPTNVAMYPDFPYFRYIFCIVGVMVAITSFCALNNARMAIRDLVKIDLQKKDEMLRSGSPDDTSLPVIGLSEHCDMILPWKLLPLFFSLAWIGIFFILLGYP